MHIIRLTRLVVVANCVTKPSTSVRTSVSMTVSVYVLAAAVSVIVRRERVLMIVDAGREIVAVEMEGDTVTVDAGRVVVIVAMSDAPVIVGAGRKSVMVVGGRVTVTMYDWKDVLFPITGETVTYSVLIADIVEVKYDIRGVGVTKSISVDV